MPCRALPCPPVPCRGLPWGAVLLCGGLPCCAVLRVLRHSIFRTYQAPFEVSYQLPVLLHQVCTYVIVELKQHTPSSAQPSDTSAAQRSAVRCRALSCLALRCGAVPCRAVLYFEHAVLGIMRSDRYQVPGIIPLCSFVLVFLLSSFDCPFSVVSMFFFFANFTRILPIRT